MNWELVAIICGYVSTFCLGGSTVLIWQLIQNYREQKTRLKAYLKVDKLSFWKWLNYTIEWIPEDVPIQEECTTASERSSE